MSDVVGGELSFSTVKGFRLQDFDTTCPVVPERQCPEKVAVVSLYTAGVSRENSVLSDGAQADRDICTAKLTEYRFWAKSEDCAAAAEQACPTRDRMNNSTPRQIGVLSVRKIMSVLGIRGH